MSSALLLPGDTTPSGDMCMQPTVFVEHDRRSYTFTAQKRYIPVAGDIVVGTVVHKSADYYRVDIRAASLAVLPVTAFNGATKRHKPNLNVGSPVICYITVADPFMDVELSCEDKSTQKDWSSNETLYGPLSTQLPCLISEVSLCYAEQLQSSNTLPLINALGRNFKFEIAVGKNGKVFITTWTHREVLGITKAVVQAERLTGIQTEALCKAIKQNLDHE